MENKNEDQLHWADEKEVVSSNRPIKYLLHLLKFFPSPLVHVLIFPVGFFYFIFSKRARTECKRYQKILKEFSLGKIPKKVSSYTQIVSFSLCVLEKLEGWLGKFYYKELHTFDDDMKDLQEGLEEGHGAILLGSHLGNLELMRSLSNFGENGVKRKFSVTTIMEINATEQFNKTLKEINPNVDLKVISPSEIGPDTIIRLEEELKQGGLLVIAADRTSAKNRSRIIKKNFLGKEAEFPYGTFLMVALLKFPVYHVYAMRSKTITLKPIYNMYVEKSQVNLNCSRNERDSRIDELCCEYVGKLEKFCMLYPYQWYNFFNFWNSNENDSKNASFKST